MSSRIAVVVGAGSGVGQATALSLHGAGFTVVAVDRNEAGLRELGDEIRQEVADSTDPAAPAPLMDRIAAEVGPPDILVNTIGAYAVGDALSVTPEGLNSLMNVNLGPALWLTQAVVPHMKTKGSGTIVHIGARHGVEPMAGTAAYGVTKAALVHLCRILDLELRPLGIRVNVVLPQLIATAKNKALVPAEYLVGAVDPEAIAAVIGFLVSDASSAVNGAAVPAYGG